MAIPSLLGGLRASGTITTGSTDDITEQGLYTINTSVSNNPIRSTAHLLVLGKFGDERRVQMIWHAGGGNMFYRTTTWDGVWQSWQKVSANIPDFYKNYGSLAELKAALATI